MDVQPKTLVMSPYLACRRHPHISRLSVKLFKICYRTVASCNVPAMFLVRKHYCKYLGSEPGFAVYLHRCAKNLQTGQSLFESSLKILEEKSPFWAKRTKYLFRSVILTNRVGLVTYVAMFRCCGVNPWVLGRLGPERPELPSLLASYLVYAACAAFLWEQYSVCLGKRDSTMISQKAQVRFLLKCLDVPKDGSTLAKMRDARTERDFADLGITKDVIKKDASIHGVLAMILTLQKKISQAQAAREKRRQR